MPIKYWNCHFFLIFRMSEIVAVLSREWVLLCIICCYQMSLCISLDLLHLVKHLLTQFDFLSHSLYKSIFNRIWGFSWITEAQAFRYFSDFERDPCLQNLILYKRCPQDGYVMMHKESYMPMHPSYASQYS